MYPINEAMAYFNHAFLWLNSTIDRLCLYSQQNQMSSYVDYKFNLNS